MKIVRRVVVWMVAMLWLLGYASPVMAYTCENGTTVKNPAACAKIEDEKRSIGEVIADIINVILPVLGVVAVIMMIIGGIQYMTSVGDPSQATRGTKTIIYGLIGLVISLLAWAIVNFVASGVQVGGGTTG